LRAAFHDAGHAVVGYLHGAKVDCIRIDHAEVRTTLTYDDELMPAIDQVALCRAGVHGGALSGVTGNLDENRNDEGTALHITMRAHPDDPAAGDALWREGDLKAKSLVNTHARAVAAIAGELVRRGVLEGDYLGLFLGEQLPHPQQPTDNR
jgi:hypothetical protein